MKSNNIHLFILIIIFFCSLFVSCKKIPKVLKKITKETEEFSIENVSKKIIKNTEWDEILNTIRKDNPALATSLDKLDKDYRKILLKAFQDDKRFYNSLTDSKYNLIEDFNSFTKDAPKLSKDLNFLKMFVGSRDNAVKYGAIDIFDEIKIKEQGGAVLFIEKNTEKAIAKYRDGILELNNAFKGRTIQSSLFNNELWANVTYKIQGNDGLLYRFNVDKNGRIASVNANYISPNDISTNIINKNFDIYLGKEWETSMRQLKQTSKGNDVEVKVVYKYVDNSTSPKYAIIETKIRGKSQLKGTFENINNSSIRHFTVAENNNLLKLNAQKIGLSDEQLEKLLGEMNADEELAKLIHLDPIFNIKRWLSTRNHVDETKILFTSNNRIPVNAKVYAGNVYYFNPHLNSKLKARLKNNSIVLKTEGELSYDDLIKLDKMYPQGVPFTKEGYPDFSKVAFKDKNGQPVRINIGKLTGDRKKDINNAEKLFQEQGYEWRDGFTWHHEENSTYLLRVPTIIHQLVDHSGGMSTL